MDFYKLMGECLAVGSDLLHHGYRELGSEVEVSYMTRFSYCCIFILHNLSFWIVVVLLHFLDEKLWLVTQAMALLIIPTFTFVDEFNNFPRFLYL